MSASFFCGSPSHVVLFGAVRSLGDRELVDRIYASAALPHPPHLTGGFFFIFVVAYRFLIDQQQLLMDLGEELYIPDMDFQCFYLINETSFTV